MFGEKNKKRMKKREEKVPLAWVNLPLFDYLNMLCTGDKTLHCWHVNAEDPLEDLLNPIGQFVVASLFAILLTVFPL